MRSRDRVLRPSHFLTLLLLMSMSTSGCQVGRTFFQMDSNSPSPFMGVDLLPNLSKKSPTEGVSRFQNEIVTDAPTEAPAQQSPEQESGRLTRLLGRSTPSKQMALPTTDVAEAKAVSTNAPVEEFR